MDHEEVQEPKPAGDADPGRRRVLTGAAAGLGSWLLPDIGAGAAPTPDAPLATPDWDAVPACTPSATDRQGQGPFFVHDEERDDDASLFRQDIRGQYNPAAEPGMDMHLHLRVLDATGTQCNAAPLAGLEVYVWHCDAQGFYSGFGNPGEQNPDQPYRNRPSQNALYNNARFCRGAGLSNADGVVSFRSVFPGWYNGRDIHIHVMVLKRGSVSRGRTWYRGGDHLFTTQLYFDPALTDQVHRSREPYRRRTALPAYAGSILADERGNSGLRMRAVMEPGHVTAQMQLLLDPGQSRA